MRAEHLHGVGRAAAGLPGRSTIDGEAYWDGGLVSNTPLEYILDALPRRDTLALQVDLWSARGPLPKTMTDVLERMKDIQYSSRTRHGTDTAERLQRLRRALREVLAHVPAKGALDAEVPPALEPGSAIACST